MAAEHSNIREFRIRVERFADRADGRWRERVRAVALRALQGVVLGTRVDTGRARGNWQVGLGDPPEGFEPDRKDKNGSATIAAGGRVIAGAVKGANLNETIWLHNGVPYIKYLEDKDKMVAGNVEALNTWLASQGGAERP